MPVNVYTCVPDLLIDEITPIVLPAEASLVVPTKKSVPESLATVQTLASPDDTVTE